MCGVLAIMGQDPGTEAVLRMRDTMTHRGPDGAGFWRASGLALAHRRLAVLDTSDHGLQPMHSSCGGHVLSYNGEIYNDRELRSSLDRAPTAWRSTCDSETLIELLAECGMQGVSELRGMFAFVWADLRARRLHVCRDPFGIKPLYWARTGQSVTIASEIGAILAHPEMIARPDLVTLSSYLTTLRVELDDRTMFEGVRTVRPGEVLTFDLDEPFAEPLRSELTLTPLSAEPSPADVAHTIEESIVAHLRTDVPICSLLSGGLDSTIIAGTASRNVPGLKTYCAGDNATSDDPSFAREVAQKLGTHHTEAIISREMFLSDWREMVELQGLPMCTPNEVAIRRIARTLRADGSVVALTGEGADEIFAGYEMPMRQAAEHVAAGNQHPGLFQLNSSAWVPTSMKEALLMPGVYRAIEGDAHLKGAYESLFAKGEDLAQDPLHAHLLFHQRVNLVGLLRRLDSATMLESVESRTPFADREVWSLASALPMRHLYDPEASPIGLRTKRALREAFRESVPSSVLMREKASFPMPFQSWIASEMHTLTASTFAKQIFTPAAIHTVAADPINLWNLAWPMLNIALWGEKWWGPSASGVVLDTQPARGGLVRI